MRGDVAIGAFVALLLAPWDPAAIPRLIIAVIIDALDCVGWRRLGSHVGAERLEGVAPALAYGDGSESPAIIVITATGRLVAPADHTPPRFPRTILIVMSLAKAVRVMRLTAAGDAAFPKFVGGLITC